MGKRHSGGDAGSPGWAVCSRRVKLWKGWWRYWRQGSPSPAWYWRQGSPSPMSPSQRCSLQSELTHLSTRPGLSTTCRHFRPNCLWPWSLTEGQECTDWGLAPSVVVRKSPSMLGVNLTVWLLRCHPRSQRGPSATTLLVSMIHSLGPRGNFGEEEL